MPIIEHEISTCEATMYRAVFDKLFERIDRINVNDLLGKARIISHTLPRSVRELLVDFACKEGAEIIVLRGLPLRLEIIPKTPDKIVPLQPQFADYNDAVHIVTSHLVGDVFTWSTIQFGNIINDVLPIAGNADRPISSGFNNDFGLHTEDAFTDLAGEHLSLMCLRNPDRVPTILASVRDINLTNNTQELLREPVFNVSPNVGHELGGYTLPYGPIMFDHRKDPYIRINVNYDAASHLDEKYKAALYELISELKRETKAITLHQGDCLYINNCLVAHGRQAYKPRLDGTDRWYRRLYLSNTLHRSRHLRQTPDARVVDLGV